MCAEPQPLDVDYKLERTNVFGPGLVGSLVAAHFVLYGLAFGEGVETVVRHGTVVKEDVIAPVLRLDEAEASIIDNTRNTSL
jgi:hypothetical protein